MLLNEPIAKLRTLSTTLLAADGETLLSLATAWLAGMVKVSRNGATFVDAANLPVAVTGGGDGAFDFELSLAEVATPGTIRVRFYDALGELIGEFTDEVEATVDEHIRQNETNASERVLEATIYDTNGDLLAADTEWSAGMVKISKAGAAFENASALPVAVDGGGDGAFRLQFSQAETDTVGNLRVRFYTSGGTLIGEFISPVRATAEAVAPTAVLGVHWSTEMAAEFAGDMGDAVLNHTVSTTLDPLSLSGAPIRSTTDHTCKALTLGYRRKDVDGTSVLEGDFRVIALRGTFDPAVTPTRGDTYSIATPGGGSTVAGRIVRIEAITEAFVTAQVRIVEP